MGSARDADSAGRWRRVVSTYRDVKDIKQREIELLDTPLADGQREYLQMVRSSAEALLAIINDTIDFSRIEAGKLAVERTDFWISSVISETCRALALSAHECGIESSFSIPPEMPSALRGDPLRLRQVLTNLIMDADLNDPGGYALVERYRKHSASVNRVVMTLCSHSQREGKERCTALGIQFRLAKPFTVEDPCDVLRRHG